LLKEAYCRDETDLIKHPGSPDFVTGPWICTLRLRFLNFLLQFIFWDVFPVSTKMWGNAARLFAQDFGARLAGIVI